MLFINKEYDDKEFKACDIKLIILGDSAVGKSKFLLVYFLFLAF